MLTDRDEVTEVVAKGSSDSATLEPTATSPQLPEATRKNNGRWIPGQSGNPAGRPKGSRNVLGEEFVAALRDDFAIHGQQVLADARQSKPADYLKVIANVIPREIKHSLDDMSDGALGERIGQLAEALGLQLTPTIDVTPDTKKAGNSQS